MLFAPVTVQNVTVEVRITGSRSRAGVLLRLSKFRKLLKCNCKLPLFDTCNDSERITHYFRTC